MSFSLQPRESVLTFYMLCVFFLVHKHLVSTCTWCTCTMYVMYACVYIPGIHAASQIELGIGTYCTQSNCRTTLGISIEYMLDYVEYLTRLNLPVQYTYTRILHQILLHLITFCTYILCTYMWYTYIDIHTYVREYSRVHSYY